MNRSPVNGINDPMKTIAILICATGLASSLLALEVPLTIEEPTGVARQAAPVSSGVCFPRGTLRPDQQFSLWDGETEVPLQVTPLVVERDDSLRWVLLDFQLSLAARESKQLLLRTVPGKVQPATAIQSTENNEALAVSTGPLRFTISKTKPFTLFDEVRVGGVPVVRGGAVDFVEGRTGERYQAGKPKRVTFEYKGPLRVTVRVDFAYEGAGDCQLTGTTRITAWAGRTDVRVQHILANSNSEQVYHANIARASLVLHHTLGTEAVASAGAGNVSAKLAGGTSVRLHQGKENRYYREPIKDAGRAGVDNETKWTGADSGGWLVLRGSPGSGSLNAQPSTLNLFVCDRDFRGDPPRKLMADARSITLEYISDKFNEGRGVPFRSDHYWLYDLSHKTAELWIDFAATGEPDVEALAARSRLLAFAPAAWYAQCDVFGVGPFGSLTDEEQVYHQWGWKYDAKQLPQRATDPDAFVRWEDNHYESEADSPEALLLMAIRTGQRGFFDQGEAWARYHANLHAWRTDGWIYDDGAIWFPQGGPLGTKPARKVANIKYQQWDKGSGDDKELWHQVQAKSCYCHFYGAGLVDAFLLTGELDFLEAALDLAEQKNSEFRKHRQFTPGKTTISDTRGFGRGFYVLTHLQEAVPDNEFVADLTRLCRDVLWKCPNLDERGFAPCHIGAGFGGFDPKKDLPAEMRTFMAGEGITMDERGWLTDRAGQRWPVVCLGGTWQHFYVQAAAERYARITGDEDMADFTYAFGRFATKFLLSQQCKQTWYYAYMDVPKKGLPWDPWQFQPAHTATRDGDGCVHDGYYTRFFPDAIAKAYSLSGEPTLLKRAQEFWHYGSKRGYQVPRLSAGWDGVGRFANHVPPKDDSVLSTSRLFYEWSHPRADREPPETIRDLRVRRLGNGKAEIRFTAPSDRGGGKVARYQVKCSELPLASYDDFEFARDNGKKRNFWRATNLTGEPAPSGPGTLEAFVVTGVPNVTKLYFGVVSYDDSHNRSQPGLEHD